MVLPATGFDPEADGSRGGWKGLIMSKPYVCFVVLVLTSGILLSGALAQEDGENTEAKTKSVTLAQLRKAPESFRGVPCEFELTFHGFTQIFNPYFTRFIPETYTNFSAWGLDQKLWDLKEYKNDFSYLFVAKFNPNLPQFLKLKRFDRIQVVGEVRDTFKGNPWIEVYSVKVIPGKLAEESLIHRVRGDVAIQKGRTRIAVKEYNQALAHENLPEDYVIDLMTQLGTALYRTRDFEAAKMVFQKLAAIQPENKHSQVLAAQSEARAKEQKQIMAATKDVVPGEEPAPDESKVPPTEEQSEPANGGTSMTAPHSGR